MLYRLISVNTLNRWLYNLCLFVEIFLAIDNVFEVIKTFLYIILSDIRLFDLLLSLMLTHLWQLARSPRYHPIKSPICTFIISKLYLTIFLLQFMIVMYFVYHGTNLLIQLFLVLLNLLDLILQYRLLITLDLALLLGIELLNRFLG